MCESLSRMRRASESLIIHIHYANKNQPPWMWVFPVFERIAAVNVEFQVKHPNIWNISCWAHSGSRRRSRLLDYGNTTSDHSARESGLDKNLLKNYSHSAVSTSLKDTPVLHGRLGVNLISMLYFRRKDRALNVTRSHCKTNNIFSLLFALRRPNT